MAVNSTTALQNWLWQAGPFLIWSDGVNLPIFFDGDPSVYGSVRSLGPVPTPLAATASKFTVPAVNQYVLGDVNITPTPGNTGWSNGQGPVLIGSALYYVQSYTSNVTNGIATITLQSITTNLNNSISPGAQLTQPYQYVGTIINATDAVTGVGIQEFPPLPIPSVSGNTTTTMTITVLTNPGGDTFGTGALIQGNKQQCGKLLSSSQPSFPNAPQAAIPATGYTQVTLNFTGTIANIYNSGSFVFCTGASGGASRYTLNQGDTIQIGGISVYVDSVTYNGSGNPTSITVHPVNQSDNGKSVSGSISLVAHTVLYSTSISPFTGSNGLGICNSISTYYQTGPSSSGTPTGLGWSPASGSSTWNAGTPAVPAVPNTFVWQLSQTFGGSVGDNLSIPVGASTQTVIVQSISGYNVTCVMPSGYIGIGVSIPVDALVTDVSQPGTMTTYGTVAQSTVATASAGQSIVIPQTTAITAPTGQVVMITASNGKVVMGQVSAYGSTTIGGAPANAEQFVISLSKSVLGFVSAGDTLSVGDPNSNAYQQFVVDSVIGFSSLKCHMLTQNPLKLIPITSKVPELYQIVQKVASGGISMGQYPLNNGASPTPVPYSAYVISNASINLDVLLGANPIAIGQIIKITSTTQTDMIFQVISSPLVGGSSAVPTIRIQNINDIEGNVVQSGTNINSLPQLPKCRMGCYGMGRNWVSLLDGVSYVGSDIIGSATGTAKYNYQDAILYVSQNFFLAGNSVAAGGAIGGGTFQISGAGEHITAMQFVAQLNAALGQGPLQIFTDNTVFSNQAPADMSTWSKMTSPIQIEGLIGYGACSQDAVVQANSDLIFRLSNGEVQSMVMAGLEFNKWGNTPISREISRILLQENLQYLSYTSMAIFDNRLFMSCQFQSGSSRGIYANKIAVLNFDPISSLAGKQQSVWEGEWNGLRVMQIVSGFFDGVERCFAITVSPTDQLEIVEILYDEESALMVDNGDAVSGQPVTWSFEGPMLFSDRENPNAPKIYKRLINGEFSVRDLVGVNKGDVALSYSVYYRSDQNPNWIPWYSSKIYWNGSSDPGYRRRIPIGSPSPSLFDATNNQPSREGYDFQLKFVFTGACTFIDCRIAADVIPEPEFGTPK